jgi:hypothetical protein
MTEVRDPWKDLSPPEQTSKVSGLLVDPSLQWGLYWAMDGDRSCLLMLQYARESVAKNKLPKLRGLEIETRFPQESGKALLVIRLKDSEQREIFLRLCLDIVEATRLARSEAEAVERFLARTWRWHRLLRGGRDDRLSDDEQKGLIGELQLMQQHLIPSIGAEASVKSWMGPLDAPKDFEVGQVCIEAKARRGGATPFVAISSEHQLDTSGVSALFLNVAEVTGTSEDDPKGITVTEVAKGVLSIVRQASMAVVDVFDERLVAAGFEWSHDYSDRNWLVGPDHVFEVGEGFPRITPDMYPQGVTNLRYSLSLQACEPFRTHHERMVSLISGG